MPTPTEEDYNVLIKNSYTSLININHVRIQCSVVVDEIARRILVTLR